MKFTLRGKRYDLGKEDLIKSVRDVEPRPIRLYYVEIEGRRFPIKQPIERVLGIPPLGLGTVDAYSLIRRLGFEIRSLE